MLDFLPIFARFIYAHRRPEPRDDCRMDDGFLHEYGWQRKDDGYRIFKRVMPDFLVILIRYKSLNHQVISMVFGTFLAVGKRPFTALLSLKKNTKKSTSRRPESDRYKVDFVVNICLSESSMSVNFSFWTLKRFFGDPVPLFGLYRAILTR